MVKHRGIEVSIISQFDIQRLPEFDVSPAKGTDGSNLVSRFVPVSPGSQFWFEYVVEPPHPPRAAYFFKLLINRVVVTCWDCTEKHRYYGKMTYVLEKVRSQPGCPWTSVQRRGFKFSNHEASNALGEDVSNGMMEIRVHRIEHRKRIRDPLPIGRAGLDRISDGQLEIINGGFLEPGQPQRRYKYQLLDPANEPFAIFRFYYRTYEYLWQNGVIQKPTADTQFISSSPVSTEWHNIESDSKNDIGCVEDNIIERRDQVHISKQSAPAHKVTESATRMQQVSPKMVQSFSFDTYFPISDSDGSLSAVARDSIEALPSTVSHTFESPRSKDFDREYGVQVAESPTQSTLSPYQKLKKRFTLNLGGFTPGIQKGRRSLSPFTSAGILRRLISPEPQFLVSTASGESVDDDFQKQQCRSGLERTGSKASEFLRRTAPAGRGETSLTRLLSRRGNQTKGLRSDV